MNAPATTFVVASLFPTPSLWSEHTTFEAAAAARPLANQHSAERQYEVTTRPEYERRARRFYTRQALEEIPADLYHEKHGELPPLTLKPYPGIVEHFVYPEPVADGIYRQYALHGGRAFRKAIDPRDPSTLITASSIDKQFPSHAAREERRSAGAGRGFSRR